MIKNNIFLNLYKELKRKYKKPETQWKLWCKKHKTKEEIEEVIVGAVLTQRTNWKNVELAIENLKKKNLLSLKKIYYLGPKKIMPHIKPSGFYQAKAVCLFNLAKFIIENYKNLENFKKEKLNVLREKLLKLKGIGPETADSILLYALSKPVFVVDEYTRRLVKEKKLSQNLSYHYLQKLFQANLKKDFKLYQDFHALIVIDGKNKKSTKIFFRD